MVQLVQYRGRQSMLTARELMTPNPMAIAASTKVRRAIELLQTLEVRHLPIVNDERRVVGMFSDRDLRTLCIPGAASCSSAASEATVGSVATRIAATVGESCPATQVIDALLDDHVGAVAVTNAEGLLVGIVSYVDVLRALALSGVAVETWD